MKTPTSLKTIFKWTAKEDSYVYEFFKTFKIVFWAFAALVGIPALVIYMLYRWFE